jgi:hypothetical protein
MTALEAGGEDLPLLHSWSDMSVMAFILIMPSVWGPLGEVISDALFTCTAAASSGRGEDMSQTGKRVLWEDQVTRADELWGAGWQLKGVLACDCYMLFHGVLSLPRSGGCEVDTCPRG